VLFQDRDVLEMTPRELEAFRWRSISIVFQSATRALNPVMTIGDQIGDAIQAHQPLPSAAARERAVELLKMVGVDGCHARAYPHQLPGGAPQRAAIAIALALNPPLLVLDDLAADLDAAAQQELMRQVAALKARLGLSVLCITRDPSLLAGFATRVAVLCAGEIVETSPPRELLRQPLHPYTQSLLNSSPAAGGERLDLLRGCRFQSRCPQARPVCRETSPEMRRVAADRDVACHLY
jgi:peptide/nickel transport system ATP-binding protein